MKIGKKIILIATILNILALMFTLTGCGTAVENVVLNKSNETIKVEETLQLIGTIIPNDAKNKTITWTSSDNSIASVNSSGLVTGISEGTCTITASCDGKVAVCVFIVKKKAPDFKALYDTLSTTYGWTLGGDGSYLMADTNKLDLDDYTNTETLYSIKEMNTKLGLPDSLWNDMLNTTAMVGKQQETYEKIGIKVSWTYHPDKGLEVTYTLLDV